MKSVRLDEQLEERLSATARRLAVAESEVIRMALDEYCDPTPDSALQDALTELLREAAHLAEGKPEVDYARQAHTVWGDHVYEDWQRQQRGQQQRVAETKASYTIRPDSH